MIMAHVNRGFENVVNGLFLAGSFTLLLFLKRWIRIGIAWPILLGISALSLSAVIGLAGESSFYVGDLSRGLGCALIVLSFARIADSGRLRLITDSANFIESLFSSFSGFAFIADGKRVIRVNGPAESRFRFGREGAPLKSLLLEIGVNERETWVWKAMRSGTEAPVCVRGRRGKPRYMLSCYPLTTSVGKRKAVLFKVSDVSAENIANERLKVLSRVVDSVNDAVITLDLRGRVAEMNRIALDLFNVAEKEAANRQVTEIIRLNEEESRESLAGAIRNFKSVEFSARLAEPGGERQILISSSPLCEWDGCIMGFVLFVKDITNRKKIEQRLVQMEKLNSLGGLVAGFAHELNNPLASISGCSQLLEMSHLEQSDREPVKIISQQTERCRKVLDNLLKFARMQVPEKMKTDINRVVVESVNLVEYQFLRDDVEVELDLKEELPMVMADAGQIQHVFVNLFTNSHYELKGRGGEKKIKVSTRRCKGNVVVRIADTGPGIPEDTLSRIFEPFFTTKEIGEGTGLGLSLSFGIIEEHGGLLEARNGTGGGAEFEIILPMENRDGITEPEAVSEETAPHCPALAQEPLQSSGQKTPSI